MTAKEDVMEMEIVAELSRLRAGDPSIPAGRVRPDSALVVADRAAAGT